METGSVLCIVCYKPVAPDAGDAKISCPNDHIAHVDCILPWFLNNKHCPICRTEFSAVEMTRLAQKIEEFAAKKKQEEAEKARHAQEQAQKQALALKAPEISSEQEAFFQEAAKLTTTKNYETAITALWAIFDTVKNNEKHPAFIRALMDLAINYYALAKYDLAMTQLTKVVKINYNSPLGLFYMGLCYEGLGIWDKARWSYDRADPILEQYLKIDPIYEKFHNFTQSRLQLFMKASI
jgi:tetratricopeptide (TPR) repeat protein